MLVYLACSEPSSRRWGSNLRPADYEKHGPALRARYLH
jgi:hypothetical protein